MGVPRDDEDGPERTCVVTRAKADPATMIRFVVGPDGGVVPDIRRKLPGRGVWVSASADVLARAVRTKAFARGFKASVAVSATLPEETERLLAQDCLGALAMANKAGAVTTGFAKVEAAIGTGALAALLHAAEAGVDGVRKLEGALRRRFGDAPRPDSIKVFSGPQLDLALGRTNVIHAALVAGPASAAFLTRYRRLRTYRSEVPFEPDASKDIA